MMTTVARWTRFLVPLIALGACATPESSPAPETDTGTEAVMLTVGHRSEWRVLWIEGETDLPDGAELRYRATHEQGRLLSEDEWPAFNMIENGRATVQDGQYWAQVNTQGWPRGNVEISVQFPVPPQPPEVISRYGEFGEHLTGDNVTEFDGLKVVEVEHAFEHVP